MNSKEIETREQEDCKREIRDLAGEYWPLLVGLIGAGALVSSGVYILIELFKKRKGEIPRELEQITSEIEAMAGENEGAEPLELNNLQGVVTAMDIGQIIEGDEEAQSFVSQVITSLGYPSGGHSVKDLRDECVVAAAGLGGFLHTIFNPPEKEK